MSDPAQVIVEDVSHHYRPAVGREVLALENVSLQVQEREFLALLGPSGCGKSTLLYLIGGFLPIGTGKILVDGKELRTLDSGLYREQAGIVNARQFADVARAVEHLHAKIPARRRAAHGDDHRSRPLRR